MELEECIVLENRIGFCRGIDGGFVDRGAAGAARRCLNGVAFLSHELAKT